MSNLKGFRKCSGSYDPSCDMGQWELLQPSEIKEGIVSIEGELHVTFDYEEKSGRLVGIELWLPVATAKKERGR